MKRLVFSLLLWSNFTVFANPPHDIPLAIFNLTIEENSIHLAVLFDKVDLEKAVVYKPSTSPFQQEIEIYLQENMHWVFNQKAVAFEVCSLEKNREHYQISIDFVDFNEKLTQVELSNTCLVNVIDNHSNILNVYYKEQQRGFRLHKLRIATSFEIEL